METIITLLFILLPFIFKLIGKKFEQAGESEKAEKMREFADIFGKDDDDDAQMFQKSIHIAIYFLVYPH